MRARARLLERIARHEDVAVVLAEVARFVDPDAPERVDVVAVQDGRAVRRVTALGSGGDPDGRAPGPVPSALRAVLEDGDAPTGVELDEGDGWPAERAAWAAERAGVRWSAVPVSGDGDGRVGAVVRFAEPGDEDEEVATRLREAASLAGIALRQAELVDRLRHRAFHDALTGLPNRAFLQERLRQEMERARRDGHALGVLMLDLDDFKAVNDAYGHEAGDELLHAVAGRLAWVVRSDETVARLGGDEFVVVVRGVEAARRVAERILVAFATPFEVAEEQRIVRPSIGLARWPEDGEGAEAVLAAADSAMYRAKRSGRHVLRVYGEAPEEAR
jgi:diguanylate cyclase (GGDEF)-like protein